MRFCDAEKFLVPAALILFWAALAQAGFKTADVGKSELGKTDYKIVNSAMSIPLFSPSNIWSETPAALSARLGARFELTKSQSMTRYSAYVSNKIFGVRAEQFAFEAQNGKVSEIQIVFFNKGDSIGDGKWTSDDTRKMQIQEKKLAEALSEIFGKYRNTRLGSGRNSEPAKLWTDGASDFYLAVKRKEYIILRILPAGFDADSAAKRPRVTMQMDWDKNVEKNANGDVWIKNMPMVNQGGKGYCMPATIERCILYYGVNDIDMHKIAAAVNTGEGGGTILSAAIINTRKIISPYNLRIDMSQFNFAQIARNIDRGIPMCWCLFYVPEFRDRLILTTKERQKGDFKNWISQSRKMPALKMKSSGFNAGHVCNIVGYNAETQEIAISNSWGEAHEIEWVRFKDARAVSMNIFAIRPN